ncbi:MAG: TIGR01459 family HAD-type hydrolase [Lactobacillaceae bacterium]|jgi:HAD superfamily hydrolase (TIGR01459 family)|nr:TIGR01459 family HAD-type hydrolase [Lactobacillaceae bacterium]
MKMIKPIVSISKIIDSYDTFLVGFRGVLCDGISVKREAAAALIKLKMTGKKLILVTNSAMRAKDIVSFLSENNLPDIIWNAVVSAGEIIHYQLKARRGVFAALGSKFYCIGSNKGLGVFNGLDYERVEDISDADFLYMSEASSVVEVIEDYYPVLEYGANQSLPLLCCGNDAANYMDGQISLASGTVAEQYAIMGGNIITVGKPDPEVLLYSVENFEGIDKSKTILIGDSFSTDIKGANLIGIDSMLISKGIHVNFLGEGYIPDITKAKELAANFEVYPDFVISNLRW